ncbi:MAG TPA: accessory gene regulator B family protein [Peptococcaceae bacterium]|nr:accessory gene regulator B family protein [Peptococcaceae bacterium]
MKLSEISERISESLTRELDYSEDKKEIVTYGIETALLTVLGFLAIIALAFLFNAVVPAIIAALFGGVLRRLSGGAHFDTPLKCLTFGAVVYALIGVAAKELLKYELYSTTLAVVILLIALIVMVILAPVDCEAKPIHSRVLKRNLKISSVAFVLLTMGIILFSGNTVLNTSAVLGVFYQTMTLLPVFNNKKKEG